MSPEEALAYLYSLPDDGEIELSDVEPDEGAAEDMADLDESKNSSLNQSAEAG